MIGIRCLLSIILPRGASANYNRGAIALVARGGVTGVSIYYEWRRLLILVIPNRSQRAKRLFKKTRFTWNRR